MKTVYLHKREMVLGVIFLILFTSLATTTNFGSSNGLYSFLIDVSPNIVGAIALSLLIITGNIDISAGTIMGFIGFTSGYLSKLGIPPVIFISAGIATGIFLTAINGFITVKFGIPSIVVTLAMNIVHLGFYATFLPNSGWIDGLGDAYTWFGRFRLLKIVPLIAIVALVITLLFMFIMKYTRFGKAVYAVGGNRQAAIYAGIRPDSLLIKVFCVEGLLLGIAGMLKAVTVNEVIPSTFQGREMVFIASAVVGGVNIFGGRGSIVGALLGAVIVYLLSVSVIYMGFQDYYQFSLQGIIILVAVYFSSGGLSQLRQKIWLLHFLKRRNGNYDSV